jgi:hypothetical protein
MSQLEKRRIAGWLAVALSTLIACFWAFWGIIENFHEGWYHDSLILNVGLMFLQYLSPMFIFLSLTVLSIAFPRIGGMAYALVGVTLALVLFGWDDAVAMPLIIVPTLVLGILYWYGRPHPRRAAYWVAVGLPLLTLIICGVEPVVRVAGRFNDNNSEARLVEGNQVRLVWAAEGAGWPRKGVTWHDALKRCQHLSADGRTLAEFPQNVWRLPTVEEVVRSMSRHGINSGGSWHEQSRTATYRTRPDKESPLWNGHSEVIYWWTATEINDEEAFMIAYDGKVWPRRKHFAPDYLAYRCVKRIEETK